MRYAEGPWVREGTTIRSASGFAVGVAYDSSTRADQPGLMIWAREVVEGNARLMAASPVLLEFVLGMNQGLPSDWCICLSAVEYERDHMPSCRKVREVLRRLDPGLVLSYIEAPEAEEDDDMFWEAPYYDD